MKKNRISLAIILIILVMTLVACGENDFDTCVHNVCGYQEYIFSLNEDGESYTITGLGEDFEGTELVIPAEYNGKPVTTIDRQAFWGFRSLTSISVDENNPNYKSLDGNLYSKDGKTLIQYAIGKTATSFVIPGSVTTIGSYAFEDCDSLTSVTIGDSVTSIGDDAFGSCNALTRVTFGKNSQLTTIGEEAFRGCTSLTSITIPSNVTSIGNGAFRSCTSLKSIVIPDSVTTIDDYAFWNCKSLTSITIPDSVTSIGNGAFYSTSLTSIVIPDSVTTIGRYVFEDCTSLISVTIGDSVTTIGYGAFYECINLTNVTIGENSQLASIGEDAFHYCISLTSITIPDSVTSIGYCAFWNCKSLTSVTFEDPNGWYVADSPQDVTSEIKLTLTNPSTNAKRLRDSYLFYYWYKK